MRSTPQLSVKIWGGGLLAARPGGVSRGGGGLRVTRYYHMHSVKAVCVSGGMGVQRLYAIIAISRLC